MCTQGSTLTQVHTFKSCSVAHMGPSAQLLGTATISSYPSAVHLKQIRCYMSIFISKKESHLLKLNLVRTQRKWSQTISFSKCETTVLPYHALFLIKHAASFLLFSNAGLQLPRTRWPRSPHLLAGDQDACPPRCPQHCECRL